MLVLAGDQQQRAGGIDGEVARARADAGLVARPGEAAAAGGTLQAAMPAAKITDSAIPASIRRSQPRRCRVALASARTISELAERNRNYEDQFGFIFIVCASAKSSEEMLTIINERIRNDAETELRTAAAEQSKITRLRLEKLLNQ